MKEIHRSRRIRQFRRHDSTIHQNLTSDEDESDGDHRNLGRINKNANRTGTTTLIETFANQHSSSDQSSLHLHSINNSIPKKEAIMSDDLTPLTSSATPLTSLTTSNHTKQTEGTTVQIDLTLLTSTETLPSSSITSDLNLSSKQPVNSMILSQTDTSMKSIVFNKELISFRKHSSLPTINNCQDQNETSVVQTTTNTTSNFSHFVYRKPVQWNPRRWYLDPMNNRLKLILGCSSIGFLVGVIFLILIL